MGFYNFIGENSILYLFRLHTLINERNDGATYCSIFRPNSQYLFYKDFKYWHYSCGSLSGGHISNFGAYVTKHHIYWHSEKNFGGGTPHLAHSMRFGTFIERKSVLKSSKILIRFLSICIFALCLISNFLGDSDNPIVKTFLDNSCFLIQVFSAIIFAQTFHKKTNG